MSYINVYICQTFRFLILAFSGTLKNILPGYSAVVFYPSLPAPLRRGEPLRCRCVQHQPFAGRWHLVGAILRVCASPAACSLAGGVSCQAVSSITFQFLLQKANKIIAKFNC